MTNKFETAIKKALHDKIGCCEETLIITLVKPFPNTYEVYYYVPSLDRDEQTKKATILVSELLMHIF